MAIDSHMHLNSKLTYDVYPDVLKIYNDKNLEAVINAGFDIQTSKEVMHIADQYKKFYGAIGVHPLYTEGQDVEELYYLTSDRIVAIGEIGLDTGKNNFKEQKKYLINQIEIANDLRLPVIIHANNTNQEIISIFKNVVRPRYGCVFHCFQPDFEALSYLVDHDYFVSFAGRITYKNAKKSIEIAKSVPDDLYLVETDAPYITPDAKRNEKNCSSNLTYIIERLANIKDVSYEEIEKQSNENAKRLFKIK